MIFHAFSGKNEQFYSSNKQPFILILLLLILSNNNQLHAQDTLKFEPITAFSSAIDFCVSLQDYFYVIEGQTREIIKLEYNGRKLKQAGGSGWDAGLFDEPTAIITNYLTVYVTDKNNHRIQSFDKELNYTGSLITEQSGRGNFKEIRYPTDCVVDGQGDYFILDSDNNRVAKFDAFGKFLMDFGGINWGNFSLQKPKKLLLLNQSALSVLDESKMIVFDFFGTGISINQLPAVFSSLSGTDTTLLGSASNYLYKRDLTKSGNSWVRYSTNINENILKVIFKNERVFVLTKQALYRESEPR